MQQTVHVCVHVGDVLSLFSVFLNIIFNYGSSVAKPADAVKNSRITNE